MEKSVFYIDNNKIFIPRICGPNKKIVLEKVPDNFDSTDYFEDSYIIPRDDAENIYIEELCDITIPAPDSYLPLNYYITNCNNINIQTNYWLCNNINIKDSTNVSYNTKLKTVTIENGTLIGSQKIDLLELIGFKNCELPECIKLCEKLVLTDSENITFPSGFDHKLVHTKLEYS